MTQPSGKLFHRSGAIMRCVRMFPRLLRRLVRLSEFRRDFLSFQQLSSAKGRELSVTWKDRYPCLTDSGGHGFEPHYTYHPAWAARCLRRINPQLHIDISSTLHFATLISAFLPVHWYDYRPARIQLDGLRVAQADLTALPFEDKSVASLSCMHVVEHVGLGRYGDPLDPEGDVKAAEELGRVIAPSGSLLMVVPVGRPRVCFNAHRIYSFQQVMGLFRDLSLIECALVPDDYESTGLVPNPTESYVDDQEWGCGCFWFTNPTNR